MTSRLPPFPVDEQTLSLLETAIDPWSHGNPDAERSSLGDFLNLVSTLGGSDTRAVAEQLDDHTRIMRNPIYTDHCVIQALIAEVRRLRARTGEVEP